MGGPLMTVGMVAMMGLMMGRMILGSGRALLRRRRKRNLDGDA
jgi:hypothetical protein